MSHNSLPLVLRVSTAALHVRGTHLTLLEQAVADHCCCINRQETELG